VAHSLKGNGLPAGQRLYWNGNLIWCIISHNGQASRHSCGTEDWQCALKERDRIQAEIVKGDRAGVVNKVVRIGELLDDYIADLKLTAQGKGEYGSKHAYATERQIDAHVRGFFGKMKAASLTTANLKQYKQVRLESAAITTVNRELGYLRRALRLATECTPRKVATYPSFKGVIDIKAERARARTGTITDANYDKLMVALPDHLKPVLATVVYTGIRRKEMRFIRWEQLDFANKRIYLRAGETKSGKARFGLFILKVNR
jgi:integrase